MEDQEFSLFSEQLANDAFDALSQRAGDAECDHSISRFVHRDDLKLALRKLYEDRKEKASWFSRRTFDLEKLDGAMTKALEKLDQEESFDVTILESGEMCSNKPKLSLQCALKRKLLEHWRWVFGSFLVSIALMYMRVKLYFIKQHDLRLEEAHTLTLGFLREQLAGYRDKEEEFAFISDVVLREEVVGRPTPKNIKFWKEVEERLKKDPRLVRKQQSVKGMPSYTYEYIGSRRSSGGILDRRSSFGSRASLDSLDFRPSISPVRPQRRQPILDFLGRLFGRDRE